MSRNQRVHRKWRGWSTDTSRAPTNRPGSIPRAELATDLPPWRRIKRQDVQAVCCPTCDAAAGQPCQGRRGDRQANHLARVELALELRDRKRELPRTGASTRSIEEQSRGAVSLDGDETSATIGAALVSDTPLDR